MNIVKSFFIFCVLAAFCLHSSNGEAWWHKRSIRSLEIWMRKPVRTPEEIKEAAELLAERYTRKFKYQEAIWALRFAGLNEDAQTLETELEKTLLEAEFVFSYRSDRPTADDPIQVRSQYVSGIFKNAPFSARNEVLAYRLDRALGLDIVPMTVFKAASFLPGYGDEMGSLQYFIRDTWNLKARKGNFRNIGYPKDQAKLWLLDYLLNNNDRHAKNWMYRPGRLTVAIDHGRSGWESNAGEVVLQPELFPTGELLQRLIDLKPEDLGLPIARLGTVFERREKLLEAIEAHQARQQRCSPSLDRERRMRRSQG